MRNSPCWTGVRANSFGALPTPPDIDEPEECDMYLDEPEAVRALALNFYREGYSVERSLARAREQYAEQQA